MTLRSCPKIFLSVYREARYATIEKQLLALTCGLNKKNHSSRGMEYQFLNIFIHFHSFAAPSKPRPQASPPRRSCGCSGP